jgi:pimeloyl-ACP methyl ester carboxylesterase
MIFVWISGILIVSITLSMALSVFLTRSHPQKVFSTPSDFGLQFEEICFSTSDGITLRGWWIPSKAQDPVIIFLHGYAGSMDPDLKYAPAIHDAGFNILMFDFRAHGRSEGSMTTLGALEIEDAQAAITYVKSKGVTDIGLLGFSMGGRVALLTSANDDRVQAVVSDGAPLRLSTALLENLKEKGVPVIFRHLIVYSMLLGASVRSGKNLFKTDPINIRQKLFGKPVFLIHAGDDHYTEKTELLLFFDSIGKKAEYLEIPGVKHRETDTINFKEYISNIITFFEKSLTH